MVSQVEKFCRCVKGVSAKLKNERAAIAICTKSILHRKGRTLKKFKCRGKKPFLRTQKMIKH